MATTAEIRVGAQMRLRAGRAAEAAALLAGVLRRQPAAEVWNDWAFAREVLGNASDAECGYLQALRMDVFQPQALGNLGRLWATQGQWRQAAPLLQRAVALQGGAAAPAGLRHLAQEAREREARALAAAGGLRILFVHEHLPEADHNGADQRVITLLSELQRLGHAVTFLARTGPGQESYLPALAQVCAAVYYMDADMLRWRLEEAPAWRLDAVLAAGRFDVAVIAHWNWFGIACTEQYLQPIRQLSPRTRVIVLSEDHHGLLEEQRATLTGHWRDRERARSVGERELDVYARADLVWAVSAADRAGILARDPSLRIEVLPPVVNLAPPGPGFAARRDLLFLGAFLNPANTDGLDWFFASAWAEIKRRLPGVRLHLVGSDLPDRYRGIAGVVCEGYVPELGPVLARHRVAIAPIRFGTGAKTKGLALLAHGLPFAATPRGVDGLGVREGDGALIAEDAAGFAAAVVRLYRDQALWERLAAAGQAHAAQHLSASRLSERIRETLAAVLAAPPQPPRPVNAVSPVWVEQRFPGVLTFQTASMRVSYRVQRYLDLAEEELAAGRIESARRQCAHALIFVHAADAGWAARIRSILDRIEAVPPALPEPGPAPEAPRGQGPAPTSARRPATGATA